MITLATALADSDNLPADVQLHQHKQVTSVELLVGSWATDGSLKKYSITNTAITANHIVDVIVANASVDVAQVAQLLPSSNSVSGAVEIWAKNTPSGSIFVTLNINLKV